MATYTVEQAATATLKTDDIINCEYSEQIKQLQLPAGEYKLECWGGKGGDCRNSIVVGGKGGYSVGIVNCTSKQNLYLVCGGGGSTAATATISGGYNGGGTGFYRSGSGGGATHIALVTGLLSSLSSQVNQLLMVAGGGGGAGYDTRAGRSEGGAGGGTSGGNGVAYKDTTRNAKGGTQTAGGSGGRGSSATTYGSDGSFGQGGSAQIKDPSYPSGGGGGGYYGGGGAGAYAYPSGGGGGSGYVSSNLTEASTVQESTSTNPDSTGNGYIRITVLEVSGIDGRVKINNKWKNISSLYLKQNNSWKNINSILMKANGNWYSAGGSGGGGIPIEIVSWADGTDEQVAAMIAAAQRGQIDLQQDGGWAVGDIRSITVGAFTDAFGNSHSQQNCDIVITSFDEYENNGNVLQFDFKNGLSTKTKMNDSDVNTYKTSKMYTTLNTLADALPTWLKNSMLIFSMKSNVNGNASSAETLTNIKLALRSVKEVGLGNSGIYAYEGSVIAYYTSSTRQKGDGWWLRSPYTGSTTDYCRVKSGGALGNYKAYNATYTQRIAPFGLL